MRTTELDVPDISCEHCERAIVAALRPLAGIADVRVDVPGHRVTVTYDEGSVMVDRLRAVLAEADYEVAAAT